MLEESSLQSLFFSQIEDSSSFLDKVICQVLEADLSPSEEIFEECQWKETFFSEEKQIENWKSLLKVNVLCHLSQCHGDKFLHLIHQFEYHPWNQSSQYFRALIALNHALAKIPVPEAAPHLLESGAALIDLYEYCPWLSLPYTPLHFEFGVYLSLLAILTKRVDFQEIVLKIAQWQLNTLDINGKPLRGLFVREKEGKSLDHLVLSYLLFRAAALFREDTPFQAIAKRVLKEIEQHIKLTNGTIDSLWVLLEKWLSTHQQMKSKIPFELTENIYDPSTALVGYRSPSQHVICTLHGEHTGLGEFHYEDIGILNYGPQYLPLSECDGFGIEGNALSDHGIRRSMIEWRRGSFVLKGCTRMIDQPNSNSSYIGNYRGIWLDVIQEFRKPNFHLKTTFLGLEGWNSVAFSFFVKGNLCKIQSSTLHPRSLDRYEGETEMLTIEGKEHRLEIIPIGFKGVMRAIPLAGGNAFWGADYLIAYFLTHEQRHYQWQICPIKG